MTILEVNNLKKIYTTRLGGNQVQALTDVSFSVEQGEYVAIMGESGSGKTTLLNILAALDRATSGEVLLDGKKLLKNIVTNPLILGIAAGFLCIALRAAEKAVLDKERKKAYNNKKKK